jgi:hypothetical protein
VVSKLQMSWGINRDNLTIIETLDKAKALVAMGIPRRDQARFMQVYFWLLFGEH